MVNKEADLCYNKRVNQPLLEERIYMAEPVFAVPSARPVSCLRQDAGFLFTITGLEAIFEYILLSIQGFSSLGKLINFNNSLPSSVV